MADDVLERARNDVSTDRVQYFTSCRQVVLHGVEPWVADIDMQGIRNFRYVVSSNVSIPVWTGTVCVRKPTTRDELVVDFPPAAPGAAGTEHLREFYRGRSKMLAQAHGPP